MPSVVEIKVVVRQFTLGLCGLLKKSNLSLYCVTSHIWQYRRSGAGLMELLYVCVTNVRYCTVR